MYINDNIHNVWKLSFFMKSITNVLTGTSNSEILFSWKPLKHFQQKSPFLDFFFSNYDIVINSYHMFHNTQTTIE